MAASQDTPRAPRPSLYAAIRLAALVEQFRRLLKARVKSRAQLSKEQCQAFGSLALENLGGLMKLQACRGRLHQHLALHRRHGIAKGRDARESTLLTHLDRHVTYGGRRLTHIAMHDHLFLQHNVQSLIQNSTIGEISHILDLTTILLDRLYHAKKAQDAKQEPGAGFDGIKLEKFIANLEHLLKCLQQAALEALICYSLELLEADNHQWHEYWHHWKLLDDDWFNEWPSGRRPLSTTWPWNIKPSLVVLWGVCWMFYMNSSKSDNPGLARQNGTTWQAQPLSPSSVRSYHESTTPNSDYFSSGNNPSWRSPQPGHVHGAPNLSEAMQNAMIGQVVGANTSASTGIEEREGPSSNPYIISNSPPSSATLTTSTHSWPPQYQGVNTAAYRDITHNDWQPRQDRVNISTPQTTQQQTFLPTSISSYATPQYPHYSTPPDINDLWQISPSFSTTLNLIVPMQESQNYPSSHSDGSDRGVSVCSGIMPTNLSPALHQATSPSSDISPISRRTSASTHTPPRNLQGQITCDHPDCASAPPTFTRKCEYTKHKDKHTRPYVCNELGCEKIQGFTYSGGLLRHQREVHKQHGGPKAPRMCPHRDCKRSTGTGFSRKENLNEHLRRVHRGVGIDASDALVELAASPSASAPEQPRRPSHEALEQAPVQGRRKRTREVDPDDKGEEVREESVQSLLKRLRKQIEDKDARIHMLEVVVQNLITQQPQPQHQRNGY